MIANSEATAEACRQAGFRQIDVVPLASDLLAPGSPPIPGPGTDRHDALADARLAFARWQVAQDVLTARARGRGEPA